MRRTERPAAIDRMRPHRRRERTGRPQRSGGSCEDGSAEKLPGRPPTVHLPGGMTGASTRREPAGGSRFTEDGSGRGRGNGKAAAVACVSRPGAAPAGVIRLTKSERTPMRRPERMSAAPAGGKSQAKRISAGQTLRRPAEPFRSTGKPVRGGAHRADPPPGARGDRETLQDA